MAVVNQLNLNVGTEQNPKFVLHDINDKRISTTAVTTATHLLTCNSSVTSIAPITAANLASVLGASSNMSYTGYVDDLTSPGIYNIGSTTQSDNRPYDYCALVVYKRARVIIQIAYNVLAVGMKIRTYDSNTEQWLGWKTANLT